VLFLDLISSQSCPLSQSEHGEVWTCGRCGRRWDTNQIPREQYDAIRRTQLRFRVLPVALGLLVAALAIAFAAIADLPRWELRAERPRGSGHAT
jgi:hypothetical protein